MSSRRSGKGSMKTSTLITAVLYLGIFCQSAHAGDAPNGSEDAVTLKLAVTNLNKTCASKIAVAVVSPAAETEHVDPLAVEHCTAVTQVLGELCSTSKGRAFAGSLREVICKSGATLALALDGDKLHFQMVEQPVDDTVFIRAWIDSKLKE